VDGLIDDAPVGCGVASEQLLLTTEGVTDHTVGYWQFERGRALLPRRLGPRSRRPRGGTRGKGSDPAPRLIDFCHALLNSNEFLYVD
jgi:hypothetical protein